MVLTPMVLTPTPLRSSVSIFDLYGHYHQFGGLPTSSEIAAVLESLDAAFYKETQAKFKPTDYTGAGFTSANIPITELATIESDEVAHAQILKVCIDSLLWLISPRVASDSLLQEITAAFGETPLSCQYDVSGLVADVTTAMHVARVIELVGAAAFSGAAHTIKDKSVLTTAVSIGENEAQHQSIANLLNIANPVPGAFIPAILPREALAIAGSHISGCDLDVIRVFAHFPAAYSWSCLLKFLFVCLFSHYQPIPLSRFSIAVPSRLARS
jgi:Ferritin-like domain